MIVTHHAEKRIRQRLGLPKSAVQSIADKAEIYGHTADKFTGSFRRYMDSFYYNSGDAEKAIYHNGYMFLTKEDRLITVFRVPPMFRDVQPKKRTGQ